MKSKPFSKANAFCYAVNFTAMLIKQSGLPESQFHQHCVNCDPIQSIKICSAKTSLAFCKSLILRIYFFETVENGPNGRRHGTCIPEYRKRLYGFTRNPLSTEYAPKKGRGHRLWNL